MIKKIISSIISLPLLLLLLLVLVLLGLGLRGLVLLLLLHLHLLLLISLVIDVSTVLLGLRHLIVVALDLASIVANKRLCVRVFLRQLRLVLFACL